MSRPETAASQIESTGLKKLTFGRDEDNDSGLGSSQVMLEESSNSMVNMAISLDPLTANRVLGQVDQKAL